MNSREHYELFRYLMEQQCLRQEDMLFVDNIAGWCSQNGIPETDRERPFRLVKTDSEGCTMLIREQLPEKTIEERINAMRIRNQLLNVAFDRGDVLDSADKKLAYLFLSEYALSLPDIQDPLSADDWAFREMERLGYFKT